jgi:CRISPR-associated endonuclease Cas1
MQSQGTPGSRDGVVVASGYGLKIYVERGHLVVHDGVGRHRETKRFHRAARQLKRLIVLGHSGYLTLEAIRWLGDTGAALVQLDADGKLLATTTPSGPDLPPLRRAQALAASGPAGVDVARDLLTAKVSGQLALVAELPDGPASTPIVEQALAQIEHAQEVEQLLAAEAQAADAYWQAWSSLAIRFPDRPAGTLPSHWLTFGQRASMLTGGPRLATNPSGAILNYLYALLEAETILACHAVGLDPGLGIFHVDRRDRASMALDAMEAIRPAVDAYLLALLTQRTLSARDFIETRQGSCRLHRRITIGLAETCEAWRKQIAPVVERVAHMLAHHAHSRVPRLTPLTRSNWKDAWDQRSPERRQRQPRTGNLELPDSCRDCGGELSSPRHRYCETCRKQRWGRSADRGRQNAAQVLAALRAEQHDPGHGGRAAQMRGTKNAEHRRALRAWTGETPEPGIFATQILPSLRNVTIAQLANATGLSEHYCSLIRLGKRVPHPRHWGNFQEIAEPSSASDSMRLADTPAGSSAAKVHRS